MHTRTWSAIIRELTSFFDKAENEGIEFKVELLALEVVVGSPKILHALDLAPASRVIRIKTLRCANELPVTVHDAHVPHSLFSSIVTENLEAQHLWSLFERCGYKVRRAIQKLEARGATREIANLMGIKEGAPDPVQRADGLRR